MNRIFDAEQQGEFERRHGATVAAVRAAGVQHFVVTGSENIFYLTGATFEPLERPFFLIVGADGSRRMLVPMLELDHMGKAWGVAPHDIRFYREYPALAGDGWAERLLGNDLLGDRFAFDDQTPSSVADVLRPAGGQSANLLRGIRMVKSNWEVAQIERAARYADWGVQAVLQAAWNGGTVAETYAATQALTRKIVREVADWDALATKVIAAAWPAPFSAEPHSIPRLLDRLGAGPHVAMVLTRVNGYAAESERTFFTTPPTAQERELFGFMTRAREIALGLVQPGIACAEIDAAVNAFLDGVGFSDFRTRLHRCGHGFGLGNHEPPWIALGSTDILASNMLISIEPGIYVRGVGGYRHSDTVLVTTDGYRCLTRAPSNIDALVLGRPTLRHRIASQVTRHALRMQGAIAPRPSDG
ncbi:Xaa-Pro peptidase family protein [Variovorax sp. H27-G14]|uniref:M24 family metallopeptidase n=1 Tax=Variovorax sp. H27-G14 TaxID=3111914 RepID=UPI0038FC85F8